METKISNIEIYHEDSICDISYFVGGFQTDLMVTCYNVNAKDLHLFVKDLVEGKNTMYYNGCPEEYSKITVKDGVYTHYTYCKTVNDTFNFSSFKCLLTPMIVRAFQEFEKHLNK